MAIDVKLALHKGDLKKLKEALREGLPKAFSGAVVNTFLKGTYQIRKDLEKGGSAYVPAKYNKWRAGKSTAKRYYFKRKIHPTFSDKEGKKARMASVILGGTKQRMTKTGLRRGRVKGKIPRLAGQVANKNKPILEKWIDNAMQAVADKEMQKDKLANR